jgi:WXG100 family type VII secretion target
MTNQQMENSGDALGQSIALTRQAKSDFSTQISSLNGKLAEIGSHWQGQGAVAFVRVQDAWNNQVTRLLSALEEFGDNLEGTEKTFNVTDTDVTDSLSQLTNRLG